MKIMPPKCAKNSEPEDDRVLCRLDVKLKISTTTPRIQKGKLVMHYLTQQKSVTILLFLVNFLLINITGLEYAENPSFGIPI